MADWKCYAASVETIRDVSVFCRGHSGALRAGLSWYATYILFQAILVLEMSQVDAPVALDGDADSLTRDKSWEQAISQGRTYLELLKPDTAAGRCLGTLNRIHAFLLPSEGPSQPSASEDLRMAMATQDQEMPASTVEAGVGLAVPSGLIDVPWNMSVDPSIHMVLNGQQMDAIFHGVEGFPGTLD